MFENGKSFSELEQTCLELATLNIKLNPLKEGTMTKGNPTYILFDKDRSKAELFLPDSNEGLIMYKTSQGNWSNGDYKLIAWKGGG